MIRTDAANGMLLKMKPGQCWDTPVMNGDEMAAGVKPGEGQLLYGLVRALCPRHILEWGTGYGYSTIHLAAAMRDNLSDATQEAGLVHTIESNADRRRQAGQNIREADLDAYVLFVEEQFGYENAGFEYDFVLLDAGHTAPEVREYLEHVKPRLTANAVVAIHDGCWQNHAREAAGDEWNIIEMPGTSTGGLVLMTLKEAL